MPQAVVVFWFRRDLRLHDNAGLYHALKSGLPVLPVFIFDTDILSKLQNPTDARVSFIYQTITQLNAQLQQLGSQLLVKHATPTEAFTQLMANYEVKAVYANHDYEPAATQRDEAISQLLATRQIPLHTFKDQVIFERNEVCKADGLPYTVFTPYKRRWMEKLNSFYLSGYPNERYQAAYYQTGELLLPSLADIGFKPTTIPLPSIGYEHIIEHYGRDRDFPALDATSRIGLHLRFGTVSIRQLAQKAFAAADHTWLNELIWREFYMMILYHFPHTVNHAFKPDYDKIEWVNNAQHFAAWCQGRTGYPLVDAGMRQLNTTGYMHNRVRMVVASFLTKHLLIDWRWGERYFAEHLLDFELASNVGGWQWAAGSGTDAAPYFRVFNPELQLKKFDPKLQYIKKWVAEYADFSKYPQPIVEHTFARNRCLAVYKKAVGNPPAAQTI